MYSSAPPLVVDLDDCLIQTDLLWESCLLFIKKNPLAILFFPFWLLRGKAYFKRRIAQQVQIDPEHLPYHAPFLKYLYEQHKLGRSLVLATASDKMFATTVAQHLHLFNKVIASDGIINCTGDNKLSIIIEIYGEHGIDYAGNATVDLKIWPHAREAIIVSPQHGVEDATRSLVTVAKVFHRSSRSLKDYLAALRVHQWLKNLLLFVPLFTAHAWQNIQAITHALMAFLAFSLCASSIYIFNDLLDLPADRSHPQKRKRPFAAGTIPVSQGIAISFVAIFTGLTVGALTNLSFLACLILYIVITTAYSIRLKTYALVDIIILASLYTLRIIAGGEVTSIPVSFWLLVFSMFLFLSLAAVKRYSEVVILAQANKLALHGRDYRASDLPYVLTMGVASGYLSVFVFTLYLQSSNVMDHYTHHELLWLLCPLFFYWISRIWLKATRMEISDDPLIFTLYDRGSRYIIVAILSIVILAL